MTAPTLLSKDTIQLRTAPRKLNVTFLNEETEFRQNAAEKQHAGVSVLSNGGAILYSPILSHDGAILHSPILSRLSYPPLPYTLSRLSYPPLLYTLLRWRYPPLPYTLSW